MLSFYRRADRKLRALINTRLPNSYDFANVANDEHRSAYKGAGSRYIFFKPGKTRCKVASLSSDL